MNATENELFRQLQDALGDHYQLTREIGGGGMSRIFLARERHPARLVVVKVLPPDGAGEMAVRRFRHEIAVMARLQHPHILPVLAAGEREGVLWYVTPYLDADTLRHRLNRDGRLPLAEAVRLLLELADALGYVHRQGSIHRDVKPENVLLQDGHVVLADFGGSLALNGGAPTMDDEARGPCLAMGTPGYMSPEQAAGDPAIDARADLYSLGVVAYELLTGRVPFLRATPHALLLAHLREQAVPVERLRPEIPPALALLVRRALSKDPAERLASAAECQATLARLAAELSIAGPTDGVDWSAAGGTPRTPHTPRWRRWAATGVAAVLLGAAHAGPLARPVPQPAPLLARVPVPARVDADVTPPGVPDRQPVQTPYALPRHATCSAPPAPARVRAQQAT